MHVLIAVLITCLFAGLPARGHAQDPVLDIVKNLKEALEPPRPSLILIHKIAQVV